MDYYISKTPAADGWYGMPTVEKRDDTIKLPENLLQSYVDYKGYVTITLRNDAISSLSKNAKAYNAYLDAHPETGQAPTLEERVAALETAAAQSDVPDRVAALENAVGDASAGELADMKAAMQQALGPGGSVDVADRVGTLEDSVSAMESDIDQIISGLEALA